MDGRFPLHDLHERGRVVEHVDGPAVDPKRFAIDLPAIDRDRNVREDLIALGADDVPRPLADLRLAPLVHELEGELPRSRVLRPSELRPHDRGEELPRLRELFGEGRNPLGDLAHLRRLH